MNIILRMLSTLTLIGIISGGLLSLVNNWSAPLIEQHMQEAVRRAISTVHADGVRSEKISTDALELYRVFDEGNRPVGYAMSVTKTWNPYQASKSSSRPTRRDWERELWNRNSRTSSRTSGRRLKWKSLNKGIPHKTRSRP
jgi:lipopolysaccharide export LptBFGC system permease protein LptF